MVSPEITVMDSAGVIRQIIERSEDELSDPEEDERMARAIALSLTSPEPTIHPKAVAKAARTVRFNLPLLDPPPRHVPVIPRLRSVRSRPPPAPTTPKPGPPAPPTHAQRLTATMQFYQSTGQRSVTPFRDDSTSSRNGASGPVSEMWSYLPDSAYGPPEVTPEPEPEPTDSDADSFVFDPSSSSQG